MADLSPPTHLSERSKLLWESVVPSRCRSAGRLAMLLTALESLDRAEQCRQLIADSELVTITATTKAVHLNPLVKFEKEIRAQFIAAWERLCLDFDPDIDGVSLEIYERKTAAKK